MPSFSYNLNLLKHKLILIYTFNFKATIILYRYATQRLSSALRAKNGPFLSWTLVA
jgi:hypothetical protein